jgi:protein-S-isoprenylcysteine O-methyltransferase Ste14
VAPKAAENLALRLFRYRGLIGFTAYLVVFWVSRPGIQNCLAALPLLAAGLGLRFWAMGYIGQSARSGVFEADRLVVAGPFRWFKLRRKSPAGHPLYVGNFLLTAGVLVALNCHILLGLAVMALFCIEYGLMASAEETYLARRRHELAKDCSGFQAHRALVEWRTWIVTAAAWGFALGRALLSWGG